MSDTQFPELRDEEWLEVHDDLSNLEIAELLGCAKQTVSKARIKVENYQNPHWSDMEIALLIRFYPTATAQWISGVLVGRSDTAIWKFAGKRLGLKKIRRGRALCAEAEKQMWLEVHQWICETASYWVKNGDLKEFLSLTWSPAQVRAEYCRSCTHLKICKQRGQGGKLGLCERLTVAECLKGM